MKTILTFITLCILASSSVFGQKVKFKKENIIVEGEKWGIIETEIFGKKFTFSTLDHNEYVTITYDGVKTGSYDGNGKEIEDKFIVVNFLGIGMEPFETEANTRKQIVQWLVKTEVIQGGVLDEENALKFKEKYQHDVSGKYQKGTTIIINN